MEMNRDLDQILDHCLSEIQAGGKALESCLEQFSEHAVAVEPLLRLAAHSHAILAPSGPRSSFVEATRIRLLNRINMKLDRPSQRPTQQKTRRRLYLRPAYVLVASALVLALFGSGLGVLRASADTLPGDGLYGIKLAREKIQLTISLSAKEDQALLQGFAEERLEEARHLLDLERYEDIDLAMNGLDQTLESLEALSIVEQDLDPAAMTHFEEKLEKHMEVFLRVLNQIPESARTAIENAIEHSSRSQEVINRVKSEEHPSNAAPGQLKKNETDENQDNIHPDRENGRDKLKPEKPEKTKKTPDTEE